MSEYTAPEKIVNFTATKLLENTTDSTIMLEVSNTTDEYNVGSIVKPLESDAVVFYEDVVISDTLSTKYNADIINGYIKTGILSDTTLSPTPPKTEIDGVLGSTHTINHALRKISQSNSESHLEVFYATDTNDTVKVIAYRDLDGISYSLDLGKSSIKIPTAGLNYPSEITSVAIQLYQYETANGIPKIWIGTLREGLLSYTIGADSWVSETNLEKSDASINGTFLFRRSLRNENFNSNDPIIQQTQNTKDRYLPGDYEPVYILGIINNPVDAGVPLCLYVNAHKEDIGTGKLALYSFTIYKYLVPVVKKYTLDTNYSVWRHALKSLPTDWILYKKNKITSNEIVDILKSIPYKASPIFTASDSQILTAASVYSRKYNKFCVELFKLNAAADINGSDVNFTISRDFDINDSICIEANKFSGLSTYKEHIFITEREKIWRYSGSWGLWFDASGTTPEYNFRLSHDYKFTLNAPVTYLSGLRGFGILPGKDSLSFIGLLNTDFGHLYIEFTSSSTDKFLAVHNSKILKKELFNTAVKDFQVISESSLVLSCGLNIEPTVGYVLPDTFGEASRYFLLQPKTSTQLPPTLSTEIKTKIYKNYISGTDNNAVLINKNTLNYGLTNTDQLYIDSNTESVAVLKAISQHISYVDGHSYSWIVPIDITDIGQDALADLQILRNYLHGSIKYNRLKFLLRATESIALKNYVLESDFEVPSTPEIEYQILGVIPPALPDDVVGTSQIRVICNSNVSANTINYIGPLITRINPNVVSTGVVALEGTGTFNIPIITTSTVTHIPHIGFIDVTIPLISDGLAYLPVTGTGESQVIVESVAIGETVDFTGSANILIPLFVVGEGGTSDVYGTASVVSPSLHSVGIGYVVPSGDALCEILPQVTGIGLLEPVGFGDPVIALTAAGIGYMDPVGWSRNFVIIYPNGDIYHIPYIGMANTTIAVLEDISGVHIPYIGSGSVDFSSTISCIGGHGVSGTGTETSSVLCSGTGTH